MALPATVLNQNPQRSTLSGVAVFFPPRSRRVQSGHCLGPHRSTELTTKSFDYVRGVMVAPLRTLSVSF
jgi:hypothetical protein